MPNISVREHVRQKVTSSWQSAGATDVVISSRVRLSRNLDGKVFPWRAPHGQLEEIWNECHKQILDNAVVPEPLVYYLPNTDMTERQLLVERHLVSYDHAAGNHPRGVVFAQDEQSSIMVNEEDHLRIAALQQGFDLASAVRRAHQIDTVLAQKIRYAFSPDWGFLTTCPTNVGTGMRVSCLVHIPALVMTGNIDALLAQLSKLGITVRGFYGEGSRVLGDIFQIANVFSLGKNDHEILHIIERVINGIITYERGAYDELLNEKNRSVTEDKVYRAAAIIQSARSLDFQEAMSLISLARMGINLKCDIPWSIEKITGLITLVQPAHVKTMMEESGFGPDDTDRARAEMVRNKLLS